MHLTSLYINGAEWSCGAQILACSAADTHVIVDYRYAQYLTLIDFLTVGIRPVTFCIHLEALVDRHHLYGSCRAVACAVTAGDAVGHGQTVLLYPYGMTYLYGSLLLLCYGTDGTSGTDVSASCALGAAISFLVLHDGLHEVVE